MSDYCFAAPILPGGIELTKKWVVENIQNNKGHDAVFREAGITQEQAWVQHTPMGDFAVVRFETQDPAKAFQVLGTSKDPWAQKFREFLKKVHGIEASQPAPLNQLVADWKSK